MTRQDVARPSEDDLIARYFRPLATDPGAFRLGDDCATLSPPPGHDLVLKTDAVAEGIHFFPADPWDVVAKKALRVNLSDLAAKGARPLGYLLSLALPPDWTEPRLADFARGLAEDQSEFGITLMGGDTIRSPDGLIVSITVLGAVPAGRMARRGGARPGDRIYVSGTIGDAALGLRLRLDPDLAQRLGLSDQQRDHLLQRYLLPQPRQALAPAALTYAHGAMDVSDGLVLDLTRMTSVSSVQARLDIERVPLSEAARAAIGSDPSLLEAALTGGDDYELLLTVAEADSAAFEQAAARAGVAITRIGLIEAGSAGVIPVSRPGVEFHFSTKGFSHF